ncbi:dehydrodolichyl diphosphate synthase complex subunit nus1 [Anopheles nili]|uniref:dehydrodolichyl diphosphate synthase complex subunit nus1 n=1 Tax=Anopheles nili TaxID=185578 RepID=UPI00237A95E6|nr:dehydrodolichyl diphosphate synthase complex subunit nus1 [Anopheles nili]
MMSGTGDKPESPNLLISAIWMLVHAIFTWIEQLLRLLQRCRKILSNQRWSANVTAVYWLEQSQHFVRKELQHVTKIPQHLVILLGPEMPDYRHLAKFIFWSHAAGIDYVSFYDHNGTIKQNHEKIRRCVGDVLPDGTGGIVWSPHQADQTSGRTTVTFLSPEDGKQGLVVLSRSIGESVRRRDLTLSEVSIEFLDNRIQASRNNLPDPDLAVYFGDICSTYGLLPWQIRLTEFMQLERSLRDCSELHFVNCLLKYAKCEQRLGT